MSSRLRKRPSAGQGGDPTTRSRILETAWRLVVKRGVGGVTIGAIARAARVSRQAVYLHFGDRAGVLVAMARHHDVIHNVPQRFDAIRAIPSSPQALEAYVREWCSYIPQILPVARALECAALADEGARAVWEDRMGTVRSGVGVILQRLARDGLLADGWTADDATAWCWSQIHLDNWQHLVVEVGWPAATYVDRLIATLTKTLIRN